MPTAYSNSESGIFVDAPAVKDEVKQVLDWMMGSTKTGGLAFSLAKTKQTHAYKAYVLLGGKL